MNNQAMLVTVGEIVSRVVETKGHEKPEVGRETVLLGGELPIDSLDLATVVVELQTETGRDPFKDGFVEFRTIGELADLFAS